MTVKNLLNRLKTCLWSMIFIILLSSCSYQMQNLELSDIATVPDDHGLVVIGVKSNTYFDEIIISGEKVTKIDGSLLEEADPYVLVSLPEGEYEFSTIDLRKNYYVNLNHSDSQINWRFSVARNQITYVGDFIVTSNNQYSYNARLVNNSSDALSYLESNYLRLLSQYKLVYSGSDKDHFFPFISELKGYKK